jgi:hypothetical protein
VKTQLSDIQHHCQRLNRRHLLFAVSLGILLWSGLWILVAAWDFVVTPIREPSAALLLCVTIPVTFVLCILGYRRLRHRFHLDPRKLARRIENSNAALNDLLITAADLETRHNDQPNPLEQHVLDSAAAKLNSIDWKSACTRWSEQPATLIAASLLTLVVTWAAWSTPAARKAGHHLSDWMQGSPTGLVIKEFPSELPVGADASVHLSIHRWEKTARIQWRDAQGPHDEQIVVDSSGAGAFTFYSLDSPIQFRITTPSLKSKWHGIEVYQPARLDAIRIGITPPAYTRLDPIQVDQLADLDVPEGSTVAVELESKAATEARMNFLEAPIRLNRSDNDTFRMTLRPESSGPFRFILTDAEARSEHSPERELTIIPDRPPTVEILKPGQDKVLAPDQQFLLDVYAADDYGLTSAQAYLKLPEVDATVLNLPLTPEERPAGSDALKESEIRAGISLKQLDAEDGDFLALHVVVSDNREPEPNRTRSDLLFIEIRTPIPPLEMDGMPMEQQQINLRELIDEQKRLLRETYRLQAVNLGEQSNRLPELVSALSALGVEINRVFNEVRSNLPDDLAELFVQAGAANQEAIQTLQTSRPAQSFEPQSTTLSNLLRLENAFRQNIISKNPSEGEGEGQSESESQGESGEGEQQAAEQDIDKLLEAKTSLESMIGEQNRLNASFDRAARSEWAQDAAESAAADQRSLADQSSSLSDGLSRVNESGRLRSMLSDARQQMGAAASEAMAGDASGSLRSGLRARESLRQAAAELDTMIAEAGGQQLSAAAQAAAQLAQQQSEAATASQSAAAGGATPGELASMEANQRGLRERYENFLRALEEQARAAAAFSPEASQSLMDAAGQARSQPTGSDMERAANALLYGQPGMASPLQSSAAQQLAGLSESLSEAREQMGQSPMARARALNRELMNALEELASYARTPEAAQEGRMEAIRENWSKRMEELQEISGDPRFGGLSGRLGRASPGQGPAQLADARVVLQEGARVLQEFLFSEASLSDMQINRQTAPPPDEYRRMVEEYFRRLANEPSTDQ